MRGTVLLAACIAAAAAAPAAQNDSPDSEVELVQPVENDPTEAGGGKETNTDTEIVIVLGPGLTEEDDHQSDSGSFGGFGFGNLPSLVGSFGERVPEVTNIDLGNFFGNSESKTSLSDIFGSDGDGSGISLSVSFEPVDEVPQTSLSDNLGPEEEDTQFILSGPGSREQGFSLNDLLKSISSRNTLVGGRGENRRPSFGLGGFGTRNQNSGGFGTRNQNSGGFGTRNQNSGGFGTRNQNSGGFGRRNQNSGGFGGGNFNLGGFLGSRNQQPTNVLKNIFGSVSLKPQFSLSNILGSGSGRPVFSNIFGSQDEPQFTSLGIFEGLTGEPWTGFRNIFGLYNRPEQKGYREIFGPVYRHGGGGCGLCQLFSSGNGHNVGATVAIEIVSSKPDCNCEEPATDYDAVEEETIPGGSVVRVNDTTIRVLDKDGKGVYFLLNTDPESYDYEYEATDVEDEATDDEDEATDDEDVATDDEDEATDDEDVATDVEDVATDDEDVATDDEYVATDDEYVVTDDEYVATDDGMPDEVESVTEVTQFDGPGILDEGRFDFADDKVNVNDYEEDDVYEDDQATETTETTNDEQTEIYPDSDTADVEQENDNTEVLTEPTVQENTIAPDDSEDNTTNATETETGDTQTSPTLGVDEGLLSDKLSKS
eukprot:GFUD01034004.1.p1 GENE.GFUD01034004.1~~GFUD01034004.1.p1  ORF type:complete len:653 (+),score=202.70 GFUD01034004.1:119-2077(+)